MYRIKCDKYTIYDPAEEDLMVNNAICRLEVNTVGEASFDIYPSNPYYDQMRKLRSVFEIWQNDSIIFRGRMTEDSMDYYTKKTVELEGALAYANDSIVRPFSFPEDFQEDADYLKAAETGNVVEFFLAWLLENHNSQVQDFQKLKLGKVTVFEPNNYITRSSEDYADTWEILKSKLFESGLGGYLCIRYQGGNNYVDYLADFELTNTQDIVLEENMTDFSRGIDASTTYTAVIPIGTVPKEEGDDTSGDEKLTIESYPDGNLDGDLVKSGDTIYSSSAVDQYGWIYAPVSETEWKDVTLVGNLVRKACDYLAGTAVKLSSSISIRAVDLHYTDETIQSFRIYRYVNVYSEPHSQNQRYRLTRLEIDLLNPQNTMIEVGDKILTLTDQNEDLTEKIEKIESDYVVNQANTDKRIENIEKQLRVELSSNYGIYQRTDNTGVIEPDYTKDPLIITPVVYFKNKIQTENLSFIWKRKTGDAEEELTAGEAADAGILKVSHNITGQVRYICYATYTEDTGKQYVAGDWLDYLMIVDGADGLNGEQGVAGPPGKDGESGRTTYFHVKYSSVPDPENADQISETPDIYIGTYVDFEEADSLDPKKYTWARFQGLQGSDGEQGIPGKNGADGQTSYLHIKYSNDGGKTFTANNGETVGTYIGTCVDYQSADPVTVGAYTWAKIKGETGAQGKPGTNGKDAAIISDTEPSDKTMLWCDTSMTPPQIKQWNGAAWIIVNDPLVLEEKIYKEVESKITQESSKIQLSVNETITKVRGEISDGYLEAVKQSQINMEDALKSYVSGSDYEIYKESVATDIELAKNSILQSVSGIYATKKELTTANGKLTSLETWKKETSQKITKDGIIATVGSYYAKSGDLTAAETRLEEAESVIAQHATQISQTVKEKDITGNYLIGKINLSSTTAAIEAKHINLTGAVTISALDSNAISTIKGYSNEALTTAKAAQTAANTANNRATYHYGTCSTAAATAAKVVILSGFVLYTGAIVSVYFSNQNTAANSTLNVNGTGAKAIRVNNAAMTAAYYWAANNTVTFTYNGTYWIMSDSSANTIIAKWCYNNNLTYIDGGKLYAGTVTADKINVSDLTALKATIGGWKIESSRIVSTSSITAGTAATQYESILNKYSSTSSSAIHIRKRSYDGSAYGSWANLFYVRYDGYVYAAGGGQIGAFKLGTGTAGALTNTNGDYTVTLRGVQSNLSYGVMYITDATSGSNVYPFIIAGDGTLKSTKLQATGGLVGGWNISGKSLIANADNSYIDAGTWRISKGKISNRVNDKNYTSVTVGGVAYAYQYTVQSPQPVDGEGGNFLSIRRVKQSSYSDGLDYTKFEYPFKVNHLGTVTANVLRTGYKDAPDDGVEGGQLGDNGTLYLTGKSDNTGIYFYYNKAKSATHHIYASSANNINITPYLNINYATNQTNYRLYCNGAAYFNANISANGNIDLNKNSILMCSASINMLSSGDKVTYYGNSGSYSGYTVNVRGNTVRLYAHSGGGVYLGSSGSTAITSDENLKYIYDMDDRYETFFMALKPVLYTYKNGGHRKHAGFGARQVKAALDCAGISTEEFAGLLIDKDTVIGADEFGSEQDVHFDELYSLRYEEFGPIYAMMLQKALQRISVLEKRITG
ncbi:Uncharacterised protein [uncultured Roseburia sp.]|uniref:Phage tail protein n=1 Tax=Brotonthovivens ammoniilytica TaxID=2981725 RepID=A0ABT2TMI6_9FIRM|nr:phage tail protein [Brotonthovivens ammoniilytica]MCU6763371.1 phage tail protein [Brotonthovivens ammoniilytica]SCJ15283.1 Uncharacterised protein [uncultured Roseburia sp.]